MTNPSFSYAQTYSGSTICGVIYTISNPSGIRYRLVLSSSYPGNTSGMSYDSNGDGIGYSNSDYPTSSTSITYTATLSDYYTGTTYAVSSLTVNFTYTPPPPPPPPTYPPSWTDTALVSGQVGVAYSDGVSASNMNYSGSYSVSAGSLPTGLSFNTATGAITGTPTTAGSSSFTITASNSYGSISQAFTMTVAAPATTGHVQVYNGSSWVESEVYVFNGSTWVLAQVYKYSGSAWVMSQ